MSQLYGVGLDISVHKIHTDLKTLILKKGGNVFSLLHRVFTDLDLNQSGRLDLQEFEKGLNRFGFFPKKVEVQALMRFYDKNHDELIDFREFCQGLREPLTETRYKIVKKAFEIIEKKPGQGVQVEELGRVSRELATHFKALGLETVKQADFIEYYEEISLAFVSDRAFVSFVESCWGVSANTQETSEKQEVREKLARIRESLLKKLQGKLDLESVKRLFVSFDVTPSFSLTLDEFVAAVKRVKALPAGEDERILGTLFKNVDKNSSGFIEFQEFYEFLLDN